MVEIDNVQRVANRMKEMGLLDKNIRLVKIEDDDICWTLKQAVEKHPFTFWKWWPPTHGSWGYPGYDFSGRQARGSFWLFVLMPSVIAGIVISIYGLFPPWFLVGPGFGFFLLWCAMDGNEDMMFNHNLHNIVEKEYPRPCLKCKNRDCNLDKRRETCTNTEQIEWWNMYDCLLEEYKKDYYTQKSKTREGAQ